MLESLQSTMAEGFASMTQRFDDVLALQGSLSTQLQSLNNKVDKNQCQTTEYLDSLREQIANVEELVISHQSPTSPDSLTP